MDNSKRVQDAALEVAEQYQILPEEVSVFDLDSRKPTDHQWRHHGLTHICVSPAHPRHMFISRAM